MNPVTTRARTLWRRLGAFWRGFGAAVIAVGGVALAQQVAQDAPPADEQRCPAASKGLEKLASQLDERQAQIDVLGRNRAAELADVATARGEVEQLMAQNQELLDAIRQLLDEVDEDRSARLSQQAKMLESMKPAAAAKVFETLYAKDPGEATALIQKMNTSKAGKMMQGVAPEIAASVAQRVTRPLEEG